MVPANSHVTVNTVHVYGQEKTIILRDINIHNVQDALTPAQIQCDAAALVYDASNPKSFEYIARIYIVSIPLVTSKQMHTKHPLYNGIDIPPFLFPEIFCR